MPLDRLVENRAVFCHVDRSVIGREGSYLNFLAFDETGIPGSHIDAQIVGLVPVCFVRHADKHSSGAEYTEETNFFKHERMFP